MRIAIIGAGPSGIEAGLLAAEQGHDFTIYERDEVGASLLEWGPTRFFSPFGMNMSPRAVARLGPRALRQDALPTGPEFVDSVLRPLARSEPLRGRVREGTRILGVARRQMLRGDYPGHPLRGEQPFLLHVESENGQEEHVPADVVIDATGVYSTPNPLGPSGLGALGEPALGLRIMRTLGALHRRLKELAACDVLLVGHGHSAANALETLCGMESEPKLVWATRSAARRPVVSVANDPLQERARTVDAANALATSPPASLHICRRTHVVALESQGDRIAARLSNDRSVGVDGIVSMTGYRPDLSFLSELALDLAPDTEGPALLTRAVNGVKDCLSRPVVKDGDLQTGEPNFFFAGHKSYGRLSSFLLSSGLDQLERIFAIIGRAQKE